MKNNFFSGSGTKNDPYIITTPEHLNNIRFFDDCCFKLGCDIDLNVPPYNQDKGWTPINGVNCQLDGNYKTIKNLYINTDLYVNVGLFGTIDDTGKTYKYPFSIKNLQLTNVNITAQKAATNCGALVGSLVIKTGVARTGYTAIISNTHVSGTITGPKSAPNGIGSMIGYFESTLKSDFIVYGFSVDTKIIPQINVAGVYGGVIGKIATSTTALSINDIVRSGIVLCSFPNEVNGTAISVNNSIIGNNTATYTFSASRVAVASDLWKSAHTIDTTFNSTKLKEISLIEINQFRTKSESVIERSSLFRMLEIGSIPMLYSRIQLPCLIKSEDKLYTYNLTKKKWVEVDSSCENNINSFNNNAIQFLELIPISAWEYWKGKTVSIIIAKTSSNKVGVTETEMEFTKMEVEHESKNFFSTAVSFNDLSSFDFVGRV